MWKALHSVSLQHVEGINEFRHASLLYTIDKATKRYVIICHHVHIGSHLANSFLRWILMVRFNLPKPMLSYQRAWQGSSLVSIQVESAWIWILSLKIIHLFLDQLGVCKNKKNTLTWLSRLCTFELDYYRPILIFHTDRHTMKQAFEGENRFVIG